VERDPRAGERPATSERRPLPAPVRLLVAGGAAVLGALAGALALSVVPAAAQAGVDQVTITGVDLRDPLEVRAEQQPELCAALYREVSWLVGRAGDAPEPEPDLLGPQYTLVVHVEGDARHRFHLYPLAAGGPRAFRPVEQPGDRTADEGWFFGRLSLPETLGSAGVPLTGNPASAGGGTGGGAPTPAGSLPPDSGVLGFLSEWRQGMLLTGAAVIAIAIGLGGAAYLIRRRV
jgi:hypothetical protein